MRVVMVFVILLVCWIAVGLMTRTSGGTSRAAVKVILKIKC